MSKTSAARMVEPLAAYIERILAEDGPSEREDRLRSSAQFIRERMTANQPAQLNFICTHNSRRSHLGHIWADTAARFFGLDGVQCYSGGVETTACNERTVRALRRAGFSVVKSGDNEKNPIYLVQNTEDGPPIAVHSKIYDQGNEGLDNYAAMMCCSDVDEKCPVVTGAAVRIPLHYDDPKVADDTPEETARYDERCLQIGRDMFRLMRFAAEPSVS